MPFRFFVVPVRSLVEAETELNAFLSSHRILGVERRWVEDGANPYWVICVDYIASRATNGFERAESRGRNRVDYKEVLSAEEFTVFSQLRELRKELAQIEAVPVYKILNNEQLALIVQRRVKSKADLAKIEGIGEARSDKLADRILPLIATLTESSDAPIG